MYILALTREQKAPPGEGGAFRFREKGAETDADANEVSAMSIEEDWKPVLGYEGVYEVSDYGRVRCIVGGSGRRRPPHYLKPRRSAARWTVMLCIYGEPDNVLIHRLVVEAFIGPIPDGMEVHHRDGDSFNNALGNLELVTKGQHWDEHVAGRHCQLGSGKCYECLRALRRKYDANRKGRR